MIDLAATRAAVIRYWRQHKSKHAPGQKPLFEAPRTVGGKIGQDMDSTRQWTAEDSAKHPRGQHGRFREKPGHDDAGQGKLFDPDPLADQAMSPEEISQPAPAPPTKSRSVDIQRGLLDEPPQPPGATQRKPPKPAVAPAPAPLLKHIEEVRKSSPPGAIVLMRVGDFYVLTVSVFADELVLAQKKGPRMPAVELSSPAADMEVRDGCSSTPPVRARHLASAGSIAVPPAAAAFGMDRGRDPVRRRSQAAASGQACWHRSPPHSPCGEPPSVVGSANAMQRRTARGRRPASRF